MNESSDEHGLDGELPKPQWQKPLLDNEMVELKRHAEEYGTNLNSLISGFEQAELQELSDKDWANMENCESSDPSWVDIVEIREHLKGQRDFQKIEDGLKRGDMMPAPVVLYSKGHRPNLLAGNSRLLGCRALGIRPMILAIHLDE